MSTQEPGFGRGEISIRTRGRLPHWEADAATYFVTFRLADSLPAGVLDAYQFEREDIVRTAEALRRDLTLHELNRLDELYGDRVESFLDSGAGSCHLADARVARVVEENLRHFDGMRYHLIAWCIMPNHVHVVVRPLNGHRLASIVHSWKSYTANKANTVLGRSAAFWQREYYDRLIRDQAELDKAVRYLLENPEKAGLEDWRWVGMGK